MKSKAVIGIDTSNYTTSLAVATSDGMLLRQYKRPLPVKDGECGLRQSDAVFAHVKNLPELLREVEPMLEGLDVVAVGVSEKPRRQEGSYMPCFLTGVAVAQTISSVNGCPLLRFSHQCGHIRAALYSAKRDDLIDHPFGAFHVSGGTTEMLSVMPEKDGFSVTVIGGSADLHAGQAIDRVGVMLGLRFPCGPELERLAKQNTEAFSPRGTHTEDGYIHLSGLENLAQRMQKNGDRAEKIAAFTLDYLARAIIAMSKHFRLHYGELPLVYAGGVMSNRIIQSQIASSIDNVYFAEPAFSSDNAAGIALLTAKVLSS